MEKKYKHSKNSKNINCCEILLYFGGFWVQIIFADTLKAGYGLLILALSSELRWNSVHRRMNLCLQ